MYFTACAGFGCQKVTEGPHFHLELIMFTPPDACEFQGSGHGYMCELQQNAEPSTFCALSSGWLWCRKSCKLQIAQRIPLLLIDTYNPCANLARLQPEIFLEPCAGVWILGSPRPHSRSIKPCAYGSLEMDLKGKYSICLKMFAELGFLWGAIWKAVGRL